MIVENVPLQPAHTLHIADKDIKIAKPVTVPPNNKRKRPEELRRSCQHCNTDETPRWRPGPFGRNTLCNACGLQYAKAIKRRSDESLKRMKISQLIN